MSEELRGQTAGVDAELPGTPAADDGADDAQAQATTTTPDASTTTSAAKVNLDDYQEFRDWKSKSDRRDAQTQRALQKATKRADDLERRMTETQRAADEVRLQNADPDERAAYWQDRSRRQEAEARQLEEDVVQRDTFQARGRDFLDGVGLTFETPGLDLSGGATPDGLLTLMESAYKLTAARAVALEQTRQEELAKATRQAELSALQQAGVTQVGKTTGGGTTDLQSAFNAEKELLVGSGDQRAYVDLKKKYRELGLDV